MSLFNQSTITTASAISEIAESGGGQADTDMLTRAGRSLVAAYQHFNNYANWEFTLVEAPTILVTAPFGITGVTASANGSSAAAPVGHGVLVDDFVQGQMFAAAGRVTATAAGGFGFAETFNASLIPTATAVYTVTANRDFYTIPADWKQPYDVRMLGAQTTLRPIGRRHYDRSVTSEFTAASPLYYDIFGIGGKGKLRLLRPPAFTDRLQLRYYRHLQATADPLDIPANFEPYFIAFAKWHFLVDKADASERATTWFNFARDGMMQMLKNSVTTPDDDLMMLPGAYSWNMNLGPNSVREYINDW